jgi:hypothetical protein
MSLGHDPTDSLLTEPTFGCMRHTALAPHRERVRRLVEAAREARENLVDMAYSAACASERDDDESHDRCASKIDAIHSALDAALAPFLEQETT